MIMSTFREDVSRKRLEIRLAEINHALASEEIYTSVRLRKEYFAARKVIRERLSALVDELPLAV